MSAFDDIETYLSKDSPEEAWKLIQQVGVNTKFGPEVTSIHLMAEYCSDVRYFDLALDAGGNINARDRRGITPLMLASNRYDTAVIAWFLDHGCDINDTSKTGWTALHFAAKDDRAVAFLLRRGANPNGVRVDQEVAPIHIASGYSLLCEKADYSAQSVRLLIEAGADINVLDAEGDHAIAYAFGELSDGTCTRTNDDAVRALLFYESRLHLSDKWWDILKGYKKLHGLVMTD